MNDFIAYELFQQDSMPVEPAPIHRDWMDATHHAFAYRCLPLAIANQHGWVVSNSAGFSALWDGSPDKKGVSLIFDGDVPTPTPIPVPGPRACSLFGHGMLTFHLPYLFRTPPGVNLWVKGLANHIKDGVQALEGIVETDWTAATFTMNWKLTRPFCPVRFDAGEPICMLVPVQRGLLESLDPQRRSLADNLELAARYRTWSHERDRFHDEVRRGVTREEWQRDYFKGRDPDGTTAPEHQVKLEIKPFRRD